MNAKSGSLGFLALTFLLEGCLSMRAQTTWSEDRDEGISTAGAASEGAAPIVASKTAKEPDDAPPDVPFKRATAHAPRATPVAAPSRRIDDGKPPPSADDLELVLLAFQSQRRSIANNTVTTVRPPLLAPPATEPPP